MVLGIRVLDYRDLRAKVNQTRETYTLREGIKEASHIAGIKPKQLMHWYTALTAELAERPEAQIDSQEKLTLLIHTHTYAQF